MIHLHSYGNNLSNLNTTVWYFPYYLFILFSFSTAATGQQREQVTIFSSSALTDDDGTL